MRVIFFGSPPYAVPSLRALLDLDGIEVVGIVTQPDRPRGRSRKPLETAVKQAAVEAGVPVILQPERVRRPIMEQLRALQPDLGVVAASGHILPGHTLEVFPRQVLNVHASLLPRHRGAGPIASAILAGDRDTGVTIMRVVREVDAGPIVATASTPIGAAETTGQLTSRLALLGADLLAETIPGWLDGSIHEVEQDHERATFSPRLSKADGVIDWSLSAEEIARRVRAFNPWPAATTRVDDRSLTVHEALAVEHDCGEPPGTVVPGNGAFPSDLYPDRSPRALVCCGQGALALLNIQRAGKRALDIEDYLNGDPTLMGGRLG